MQLYLEDRATSEATNNTAPDGLNGLTDHPPNRKRKLSSDQSSSRGLGTGGLLTPANSAERSRSPSVEGTERSFGPRIYNGVLQKKEGRIIAKPKKKLPEAAQVDIVTINSTTLPTPAMLYEANNTPLPQADLAIRMKFLEILKPVKGVQLENRIDKTTPSLNFTFIDDYKLRNGIYAPPRETYEGCVKKCKPNMGQNIGCEYTQMCECLEYAAVDEQRLEKSDAEMYARYKEALEADEFIDTMGLPKRFPYRAPNPNDPSVPQTLNRYYLEKRTAVYECNDSCNCGPRCKSRVVQKGRRVPLTIFKTKNRGWGVYCNEDLVAGEFIDTYLGEVITSEEADRREEEVGKMKNSYFFTLDKFKGDQGLMAEDCYVVDGQYMGGPTRFINHSCEPNCKQYVVSYNKNDLRLYNLAFFAYENIRAGTELTFDYMDLDEQEEEDAIRTREEAERNPENKDKIRCKCGTVKCRGFLW